MATRRRTARGRHPDRPEDGRATGVAEECAVTPHPTFWSIELAAQGPMSERRAWLKAANGAGFEGRHPSVRSIVGRNAKSRGGSPQEEPAINSGLVADSLLISVYRNESRSH